MISNIEKLTADIRQVIGIKCPNGLVVSEHTDTEHFYRHTGIDELYPSVTTKKSIIDEGGSRLKRWAANLAVEYIDRNWNKITPANKAEHYKAAVLAHEDMFEDAGLIGTAGHKVVEKYLKEWIETGVKPVDIRRFIEGEDARLWAITRSAELFFNDFEVIPIASELKVASIKYKFAGTLDCLFLIPKIIREGKERTLICNHQWMGYSSKKKIDCEQCFKCDAKRKWLLVLVDLKTSNSIEKTSYAMQTADYWQGIYEMTGLKPKEIIIVRLDKEKMKYEVMRVINRVKAFRTSRHVDKIYDYIYDGVSKMLPYNLKKEIKL